MQSYEATLMQSVAGGCAWLLEGLRQWKCCNCFWFGCSSCSGLFGGGRALAPVRHAAGAETWCPVLLLALALKDRDVFTGLHMSARPLHTCLILGWRQL